MIDSKYELEQAALRYGLLPFFANNIPGFSVQEMAAPGMLFGETCDDYGCWEWKGPVIREQTTAYGKIFRKKAGFVAMELLPDFLNYRRAAYPLEAGSKEGMLLEIVRSCECITSTDLKKRVFGITAHRRQPTDLVSLTESGKPKRHSLEGTLQRLQMGGWLLIADFEYKYTAQGDRYGWGVALYSTPEIWFDNPAIAAVSHTPEESFRLLVAHLAGKLPGVPIREIEKLLK